MSRCFSCTASINQWHRYTFLHAGMKSKTTDIGNGTVMHCWLPGSPKENKPSLLLVHGFGANAMWQWSDQLRPLLSHFNVYVPDLLFFGESFTTSPDRSEKFQAQCVMELMEALGVKKMSCIGISYGGFVVYRLAARYPQAVVKIVLCCAGVCLEEKDLGEGLFKVSDLVAATSILVPQTPEKLRELIKISFFKPPKVLPPSCFLADFIDVMCTEQTEEKKELIQALIAGRKCSDLPKIVQPTLIIWGEHDQIFPLELAYRLRRHLDGKAQLVIIKNAAHALNLEKPKEFCKHLKAFLVDAPTSSKRN